MSDALAAAVDALTFDTPEDDDLGLEIAFAVLGIMLWDGAAALPHLEQLRADHFYDPFHGRLFEAGLARLRAGEGIDPLLMAATLENDPGFQGYGGKVFLCTLVDHAPPTANLADYCEGLRDRAMRRELARLAMGVTQALNGPRQAAEAILGEVEREAAIIARRGSQAPLARPAGIDALEMMEAAWSGANAGVSVGLECLDRVTGGIQPDAVWIIGGRTSMGKSILAPALSRGLAQQGRGVLFVSLEMPRREVQARLIADLAHDRARVGDQLEFGALLRGRTPEHQKPRAKLAAQALASLPVAIIDRGVSTLDDCRSQALRQFRAWERAGVAPGAMVIDHLGLLQAENARDSKAAEVADVINRLKDVAKTIGAPIIGLSQVNRGPEQRQDKRPTMADLNWSGSIEQIADFVCLLYRESYYAEREAGLEAQMRAADTAHDLDLIVAKNRSGPICTLKAWIDVASSAVRDLPDARGRAFG